MQLTTSARIRPPRNSFLLTDLIPAYIDREEKTMFEFIRRSSVDIALTKVT